MLESATARAVILAAGLLCAWPASAQAEEDDLATDAADRRHVLLECVPGVPECYRARGFRTILLGSGAAAAAAGTSMLLFLEGTPIGGDPGAALIATGAIAVASVGVSALVTALGGDGPGLEDRLTPPTIELASTLGTTDITDERAASSLVLRVAPTYRLPRELGRVRLLAGVGTNLGATTQRDPRPQLQVDENDAGGTFPLASSKTRQDADLALDVAVRIGSARLEARWRPEVHLGREVREFASGDVRILRRTVILPLNLGGRVILSPRHRFTVYCWNKLVPRVFPGHD